MAGGPPGRDAGGLVPRRRQGRQAGGCERHPAARSGRERPGQRQPLARPGRSAGRVGGGTGQARPTGRDRRPAGKLYEQAGANPGSGEKTRILAAITRRDGVAWFFKMTGDDGLVAQQKPAFIEFLKSVSFPAAGAQAQLPPSHPPIDAGSMMAQAGIGSFFRPGQTELGSAVRLEGSPRRAIPRGQVRPPWRRRRARPPSTSASRPATAAVCWPTSTAGAASLASAPVAEADLAAQVQSLDLPGGKATLADISRPGCQDGAEGAPAGGGGAAVGRNVVLQADGQRASRAAGKGCLHEVRAGRQVLAPHAGFACPWIIFWTA